MLVIGDLGFSSLVLVFCLVFSAVGFVIRRKWRVSAARKEEIRWLIAMASEEAVRAELEDSLSSTAAPPSVPLPYQCAVCYCPTTTRCSRCKVVRYCSAKCQILHWRQGHKEECRPPEKGKDFGSKRALQKGTLFNSRGSGEELHSKGDDTKADCDTGNSSPESSSASFSGFSSSTAGSESSDDISVSESISSVDSRKSYEHIQADIAHGISEKNSNADIPDPMKPLSPKFASLVDSVNGFTSSGMLNQSKSGSDDRQGQCRSTSPSFSGDSTRGAVSLTKHSAVPDFWVGAVDFSEQKDRVENCSESLISCGTKTNDASDSVSTLRFSFNLLGNNIPPLCEQAHEKASEDALPADKPHGGSVSPNEIRKVALNTTNYTSMKYEKIKHTNEGSGASSSNDRAHCLKPGEVGSSACHSLQDSAVASSRIGVITGSMNTKRPGHSPSLTNGTVDHVISSVDRKLLRNCVVSSSSAPDKHAAPKSENHSTLLVKSGKDDEIDKQEGTSSRATSSSVNPRNGLKGSVWRVIDQLKGSVLSKHNLLGVTGDLDGKFNEKGLFPYELFFNLYMKGAELRPCGLVNCGNSCYANAVLQCLAFTPPLTSYFLQGLHRKACRKRDWCFTCEFEVLVSKFQEGKSPVSPRGIVSKLKNIGSQLGHGREEDAHEFLRYAIDKMQSVCLVESGKKTFSSLEEETTLIGLTFGGYFRSKIKCTRCHGKSERQERMMDLTVEIEGDIGTLEEALRQFTRTETLDGENKYRCSRCKSYEKARKKLTVLKAPNVLTIALKRFQSGKFGKLNKLVRFPEYLDLTSFMSGTSDKPEYRLYGVIVHVDIMNAAFSGHYVCYVKDYRNKWFKIDDSSVTPVEIERVLSKGAYMLFYARSQPPAPRSAKNRAMPPLPVNKTVPIRSIGKDPARRSQHSTDSHTTSNQSFYPNMHQLHRTMEDSSSDSSSLFSSNSDESSGSTASTQDSTSFDDLSDYIFGDSSTLLSSPWYSRYASTRIYEQPDGYGIRGRDGRLENPGGEGRGSDPFLHSDVKTKPCRDSSSFSSKEADLGTLSVASKLFGQVKCNVPFRRAMKGRTD